MSASLRHPHFQTFRQRDREAFEDEIATYLQRESERKIPSISLMNGQVRTGGGRVESGCRVHSGLDMAGANFGRTTVNRFAPTTLDARRK